jgi:hypothetical protein
MHQHLPRSRHRHPSRIVHAIGQTTVYKHLGRPTARTHSVCGQRQQQSCHRQRVLRTTWPVAGTWSRWNIVFPKPFCCTHSWSCAVTRLTLEVVAAEHTVLRLTQWSHEYKTHPACCTHWDGTRVSHLVVHTVTLGWIARHSRRLNIHDGCIYPLSLSTRVAHHRDRHICNSVYRSQYGPPKIVRRSE